MNQVFSNLPSEFMQQASASEEGEGTYHVSASEMTVSSGEATQQNHGGSTEESPEEEAPSVKAESAAPQKPTLTTADALLVHRALMSQDNGLARRSDLTELHKRIVQMIQTLAEGLGDSIAKKTAKDRNELTLRIDVLEESVNRMEGALRIEFEPVLRAAMRDVMAEQAAPKRHLGRKLAWTGIVLAAGLVAGTVFHDQLSGFAKQVVSGPEAYLGENKAKLSPKGGSADSDNLID